MINQVIDICVTVVGACFGIFDLILSATDTKDLWLAAVTFALFVSIVLLPFRSGHPIGSGGLVGFVSDRVGKSRSDRQYKERRDENRAYWRVVRRSSHYRRSYHDD